MNPYTRGVALIAAAAVLLSTFGLVVRSMPSASPWEVVFWRSLGVLIAAAAVLAARHRGEVLAACRAGGTTALVGGALLAGSFTFFVLALAHTTVGATLFTMSVVPLVAAVLGWIVLNERVPPRTWRAIALASAGVAVMFAETAAGGALAGQGFAVAVALCGAGYMVVLRRGRAADMTAAVALGGLLAALAAAVPAWPFGASAGDAALALATGVVQIGLGQAMIAAGARHVPVGQIALLMMIEVVLGPVWVWLAVGERLAAPTLAGGAIILAALVGHQWAGARAAGRPARPPADAARQSA